jgi:hypothetical protein
MKAILELFKCRYNLGRAVPPKKWAQHKWTAADEELFWKMFAGKLKQVNHEKK